MYRLAVLTCLIFIGCAPQQSQPRSISDEVRRMESVVRIAINKAVDPQHRHLIERGVVFVDLEDLDVPCVGLRVPLPGSDKRAFLAFTKEWFYEHTDDEVAITLLNDLSRVLSDLENDPNTVSD
jgi:hypothetical protein